MCVSLQTCQVNSLGNHCLENWFKAINNWKQWRTRIMVQIITLSYYSMAHRNTWHNPQPGTARETWEEMLLVLVSELVFPTSLAHTHTKDRRRNKAARTCLCIGLTHVNIRDASQCFTQDIFRVTVVSHTLLSNWFKDWWLLLVSRPQPVHWLLATCCSDPRQPSVASHLIPVPRDCLISFSLNIASKHTNCLNHRRKCPTAMEQVSVGRLTVKIDW